MENLVQLFTLLSEPVRLQLLGMLSKGERCVCELYGPLGLQQSTVSRHLTTLRTAGVVNSRRVGTWMHYSLSPERWKEEWHAVLPIAIKQAAKEVNKMESSGECCIPETKFVKLRKETVK